jgi:GH25 family lysozyme M1 (1,4-beta-N-acetylmuramidase)
MNLGVDVSNHQGNVEWNEVVASGVSFAFCKVTEGRSYKDKFFRRNEELAKAAGLIFGGYHFALPSTNGPQAEADFFLSQWTPSPGDRVILDIEDHKAIGSCADWALTFQMIVEERTGVIPDLYTYIPWWRAHGSTDPIFARYPLWVAAYGLNNGKAGIAPKAPRPWDSWAYWQFTSNGEVPGVGGRCDLNYAAALPAAPAPTPHIPEGSSMSVALNAHDARWAYVLESFVTHLGRVPTTADEHDLHVWVLATAGEGAFLSGLINSPEGQTYLARKQAAL